MEEKYSITGVMDHFKNLCAIPRGSGNESAVAARIVSIASERGYNVLRDEADNVLVRVSGTKGKENAASVLLQSHLDIVCEKDSGVSHDFLTDPIIPVFDGDTIHASGTTLGADDGIGVAMMIELITSTEVEHGPLELLFTTGEEVGLNGMKKFDKLLIRSRNMINLDSEEDNCAVVACAGGVRSDIIFPYDRTNAVCDVVRVEIGGLVGGHSGSDIHLGRSGAVRSMAQILRGITIPFSIISINGGGKDNAIPRSCSATIATLNSDEFVKSVLEVGEEFKKALCPEDSGFFITATVEGRSVTAEPMPHRQSGALIDLVLSLPSGVVEYTDFDPALPETSSNTASVRTDGEVIRFVASSRSSRETSLDEMERRISEAASSHGASAGHRDRYPGWERKKDSALQKKYVSVYEFTFGEKAALTSIHAGLECGLVKAAIPDMDIISIGPNMMNVHTPSEWVSISSIKKTWRLLCALLGEM